MKTNYKYFLEDHVNKIQSFFKDATRIEVLDGSCDRLNRRKHAGAQLLVDNVYYYFTASQFNMANHLYLSLNKDLVPLIQNIQDPYKVVLINKNNFTVFDKIHIIDEIQTSDSKHKYPIISIDVADEIWPLSCKPTSLSFKTLQPVKYSYDNMKHNQLHAKKIRFWSQTYHFDKTFASRKKAYEWLIKCGVYNNKLRQFYKDLKAENHMIQIRNNEAINFELISSTIAEPKVARSAPSSILDTINNIDDSAPVVQQSFRNAKQTDFDRMIDRIKKMDSRDGFYTRAELLDMAKYCDNDNMFTVIYESLFDKGFQAEAETLRKIYNATK